MIFNTDKARYGNYSLITQPALWAIMVYRFGAWTLIAPRAFRPIVHFVYFVLYSVVRLLTGIDIPRTAKIGEGFMIHHFSGVIIHPSAVIGNHCTLRQGVTIGTRYEDGKPPVIGNNFEAGAYAQVLGEIVIEDDVKIGALSLMMTNGEKGQTYVGIPARKLAED